MPPHASASRGWALAGNGGTIVVVGALVKGKLRSVGEMRPALVVPA
eukprot:gene33462-51717_t